MNNGNRTEWSPIRLNLTKSDNCIAGGRFGWHKVLLPINHNYDKICDILGFFKLKHKKFQEFFFPLAVKKSHWSARLLWHVQSNHLGMSHTVLLHCPVSTEIKTVDSQSDLRIFSYVVIINTVIVFPQT